MIKWQRLNEEIRVALENDKKKAFKFIDALPEFNKVMLYSLIILQLKLQDKGEEITDFLEKLKQCDIKIPPDTKEFYAADFIMGLIIDCSPDTFVELYCQLFESEHYAVAGYFERTFVEQGYYEQYAKILNNYISIQKQLCDELKKLKQNCEIAKEIDESIKWKRFSCFMLAKGALENLVEKCLEQNNPQRAKNLIEMFHEETYKFDAIDQLERYYSNINKNGTCEKLRMDEGKLKTSNNFERDKGMLKLRNLLYKDEYKKAEKLIVISEFNGNMYRRYREVRSYYLSKGMIDEAIVLNSKIYANETPDLGFYAICKQAIKEENCVEKIFPYIEDYIMKQISDFER